MFCGRAEPCRAAPASFRGTVTDEMCVTAGEPPISSLNRCGVPGTELQCNDLPKPELSAVSNVVSWKLRVRRCEVEQDDDGGTGRGRRARDDLPPFPGASF